MKKPRVHNSGLSRRLRRRAEGITENGAGGTATAPGFSEVRLHQELHVHPVELEPPSGELRCAQRELGQSRDRLASLYELAPVGYLTLDAGGRIQEANLTAAEMLGVRREELLKQALWRFLERSYRDTLYLHIRSAASTRSKQVSRFVMKKADGSTFLARVESTVCPDPSSDVEQFLSAFVDISDLERAERELRELNATLELRIDKRTRALRKSESRLRAVLQTAADAIITVGPGGEIEIFNPAAEHPFGRSATNVIGRSLTILTIAAREKGNRRYLIDLLHDLRKGVSVVRRQAAIKNREGEVLPVDVVVSAIGREGGYVGIIRDISEIRQLEKDLLRVSEEEKKRISADIHDGVCQDLSGLCYLASALQEELAQRDPPAAHRVALLAKSLREAADMAHDVAHGISPAVSESHSLMDALQQLADHTARAHDIICQFVCNAPSGAVSLETATHLYRVGQEAVRNAVRHARASRIELALRYREGECRLEVRDNGTGLQDGAVHGSGLGIRLMRYRASVLGGQFSIQNLADGGTLVTCTVPVGVQDRDDMREGRAQRRSSPRHGHVSKRDFAKRRPAV